MIETYLLEQFAAFARCGTLLKASEELHITQPTLSRSMKKLEEELGVSIFHRENSKLSLNETGKVAAEYAEKALQANQDLIDHVLAHDRSLRTVSIGSSSPFPINELMPTLQEYLTEKTILTELVDTDEHLLTGLKNRRYDIIILHSLPEDKAEGMTLSSCIPFRKTKRFTASATWMSRSILPWTRTTPLPKRKASPLRRCAECEFWFPEGSVSGWTSAKSIFPSPTCLFRPVRRRWGN